MRNVMLFNILVAHNNIPIDKDGVMKIERAYDGYEVKELKPELFMKNKNPKLKTVIIPETVEIIGANCFTNSNIENIIFEDGSQLKEIREFAFSQTQKLKKVDFGNSLNMLKELRYNSFCESGIETLDLANTKIDNIATFSKSGRCYIPP